MHIYTHPNCLNHMPPPEPDFAPKRVRTVMAALREARLIKPMWHEPPPLRTDELYLAHTPHYVDEVLHSPPKAFAPDTFSSEGTAKAALASAGAVVWAASDVMLGKADKAFCIVSPGGHHAEADAAGGYCFFNHVALAAIAALKKFGASRVAVVDFDAHHGNGTQGLFWNFEDRLYISLHEDNPLSGFALETGAWNNVLNIPLPKKSGSDVVRSAFAEKVMPKIEAFRPDIIFVSAGFDMHAGDPLSSMRLGPDDYRWLGEKLRDISDKLCKGRLVAVLEGGYNLNTLGKAVAAFVEGLDKR